MLTTNHALVGALIAATCKNPTVAIPLSLASHYAMDSLPHFGMAVIDGNVRARNNHPLYKAITSVDITICAIAIILLPYVLRSQVNAFTTLLCILAALAPDFAWVYKFFKERASGNLSKKGKLNTFHKQIQWAEHPKAIVVDILWFGICAYIVIKLIP